MQPNYPGPARKPRFDPYSSGNRGSTPIFLACPETAVRPLFFGLFFGLSGCDMPVFSHLELIQINNLRLARS
jgi:hypothetical protein